VGKRAKREERKAEREAVAAARATVEAATEAARWEQVLAEIRAQRCPSCGSATVSRLGYGLPRFTEAFKSALDADLIILAGCSFANDDPVWICRECKHTWGRLFPD
jgi:ribosomal protein L37AE/L43A